MLRKIGIGLLVFLVVTFLGVAKISEKDENKNRLELPIGEIRDVKITNSGKIVVFSTGLSNRIQVYTEKGDFIVGWYTYDVVESKIDSLENIYCIHKNVKFKYSQFDINGNCSAYDSSDKRYKILYNKIIESTKVAKIDISGFFDPKIVINDRIIIQSKWYWYPIQFPIVWLLIILLTNIAVYGNKIEEAFKRKIIEVKGFFNKSDIEDK